MTCNYASIIIIPVGTCALINREVCVAHENLAKVTTFDFQFNYELYAVRSLGI